MVDPKFLKFDTLSLHAGQRPDPLTGARAVPIYQTTSYVFPDVDHAAALFNLERPGHIYSRISNPTVAVLEERIAALEGGVGAVCTASGQAALHLAIATLMGAGGHIVSSASIYGGSHNLFTHTLPRFGITTTFVNPREPDAFKRAIRSETRLLFGETLGNPGLEVLDLRAVADVAHDSGVPLMIDATFTTPFLLRPFDWGADLVMHSLTKWLGGHGVAIGGVVVDSGRFDWDKSGKFPTLSEPYAGYHGLDFAEEFGPQAFVMRARAEGLRDFGACLSPANAFNILQGVETLPLRMARHCENARQVVAFLAAAREVDWVNYPELPSHPDNALAARLRLDRQLRHQGRPRRRAALHRSAAPILASRQCRRRQVAGHPPGEHDAPADEHRGACGRRDRRGDGAAVDRARRRQRPDRRSRPGAARRAERLNAAVELSVDGKPVFAAGGGRPFKPGQPTVVFVHGAGLDHTVWTLQNRYFAHHGRNVVAVDLPGRGRSPGPPLESIGRLADWLMRLVDALAVDRVALVGHSMGGLIALETASRHPDRVWALALLGVGETMRVHPELLERARAGDHVAAELVVDWGFGRPAHVGGYRAPGVWMLGAGLRLIERGTDALGVDLNACNDYAGAAAAAANIRCPTVILAGESDRMTPPAGAKALAARIAGARLVTIPNCGHMTMIEQPDATFEALAEAV